MGASEALSVSLILRLPKDDLGAGGGVGRVGGEERQLLSCSSTHLRSAIAEERLDDGSEISASFIHHDMAMTNKKIPFFPPCSIFPQSERSVSAWGSGHPELSDLAAG